MTPVWAAHWIHLKTMQQVGDAIEGDLSRLIILHGFTRWSQFKAIKEVEGFKIVQVKERGPDFGMYMGLKM